VGTEPPPTNPAPAEQGAAPSPKEPVDPPRWNPTATYDPPPPTGTPAPEPSASTPAESAPPAEGGADESAPEPGPAAPPPSSGTTVAAQNQSTVYQAIWRVQVGCRTYCHGTSQFQSATQQSDTKQDATAIASGGQSSRAAAVNQSYTVQFVWQTQLGCVAFCWSTTMNQSASQDAQTTQMATAASDIGALAENVAETLQYVWQVQHGCEVECYDVIESQSLTQRQSTSTSQSATAAGPPYPPGWVPDSAKSFFAWVTAYAQSLGVTVRTIMETQEASCLEHCGEEMLLQAAIQSAVTDQTAIAGDVPEPSSRPLSGQEPPAESPPPAAGQPPPESALAGAATILAASQSFVLGAAEPGEGPQSGDSISWRDVFRAASEASSKNASSGRGLYASIVATAARMGDTPATTTGPSGADPSGDRTEMSTPRETSSAAMRTLAARPVSTSAATLDGSARPGTQDDGTFPWLAVLFLAVAGVGLIRSLSFRANFGP
jgi:hypothetical protein